jgi:hypothetical protein
LFAQAALLSVISSAFVIDVHSKLQPDPNEQSTALLRAILLTLNQSAIPNEAPAVTPTQEDLPSEIITATGFMYMSLLISLFVVFTAMLGKQWLNRYFRKPGGPTIDRCGDRQRKCDGLEKWQLLLFVESLPVMLQVSLFFLACGLCQYMWSINTSLACILMLVTAAGVFLYVAIVIAGISSYACPFQTPVSIALRGSLNVIWRGIISPVVYSKWASSWIWAMQVQRSEPWLKRKGLATIRRTSVDDACCVSWILRSIIDQEALDAAVRLAGMIQWFDGGVGDPPYDLIVSVFEACFDPTGKLDPGARERAYYSGRAMMWIRTLAKCKSMEFANNFPLPDIEYKGLDHELRHLLTNSMELHPTSMLKVHPEHTHSHSQWISNVMLHLSWADQTALDGTWFAGTITRTHETVPLNVTLNHLLAWCIFLDSPVDEEVLKIHDKSYGIPCFCPSRRSPLFTSDYIERILRQLSKAVLSAINTAHYAQRGYIPHILGDLLKLETRPKCLAKITYEWCPAIYENRNYFEDWESLLFMSLEIGFRHLGSQDRYIGLTHTEHRRELADVVFKSRESETIADLLHALTADGPYNVPSSPLLRFCTERLVGLQDLVLSSPRLRRLVIRFVELVGCKGFERVGVDRLVELLGHLRVTVEDMDEMDKWARLLLDVLQTSEGPRRLSHWYWELLVEIAISLPQWMRDGLTYSPRITTSLVEAQEWSNLECWMGAVWMMWPPGIGGIARRDLERYMVLLSHQRPGATEKPEQWMERWSQSPFNTIPDPFQQVCRQARRAAQQGAP